MWSGLGAGRRIARPLKAAMLCYLKATRSKRPALFSLVAAAQWVRASPPGVEFALELLHEARQCAFREKAQTERPKQREAGRVYQASVVPN